MNFVLAFCVCESCQQEFKIPANLVSELYELHLKKYCLNGLVAALCRTEGISDIFSDVGACCNSYRYNIPQLAKSYKVYALDLIGFGWSEKALIDYDALVWRDQVVDFVKEIVKEPAVLVGNR